MYTFRIYHVVLPIIAWTLRSRLTKAAYVPEYAENSRVFGKTLLYLRSTPLPFTTFRKLSGGVRRLDENGDRPQGITLTADDLQRGPFVSIVLQILNSATVANASVAVLDNFPPRSLGAFLCQWMIQPLATMFYSQQRGVNFCVARQHPDPTTAQHSSLRGGPEPTRNSLLQ